MTTEVASETARLAPFLEAAYARYTVPEHLAADPLSAVMPFTSSADREVAAFVAAGLAFGNVRSILRAVASALTPLGPRPAATLAALSPADAGELARGFNHRWVFEADLANLYRMLGGALRDAGGLEPLFAQGMSREAPDVRPGVTALTEALAAYLPADEQSRRGTRYFLSSTRGGGAAKRLMMFTRWMVRGRDLDLGLWHSARPGQLLIPLDTHVARISRYIGLTTRRGAGMPTVIEITERLREIDPVDPVRFDFALSHLGILRDCPARRDPACCARCPLLGVCRL